VLLGKWLSQGDDPKLAYGDGVPPNLWAGSEAILSQYVWSKFKPVKYAQCWVFGGTLTTGNKLHNYFYVVSCLYICMYVFNLVLRAIGIPARPVTNYESAHDTEANRTIDYYFDSNCNSLPDKSADSIWCVS